MNDETTTYEPKKRRQWTERRRQEQAARIKEQKPWLKTTGPKTEVGKAAACMNALKHGLRSEDYRELKRLLRQQKNYVDAILKDIGTAFDET